MTTEAEPDGVSPLETALHVAVAVVLVVYNTMLDGLIVGMPGAADGPIKNTPELPARVEDVLPPVSFADTLK